MEFDSNGNYNGKMLEVPVPRLLPSHITVVDAETIRRSSQRHKNALEVIIDNFGKRSAVAQGLGAVITTMQKLLCSDHRLYIHRSERTVNGILKVGKKHLFIRDASADKMHEIEPMCVLDFYVHESLQKRGIGRQLFDEMLAREKVQPHMLGYDRPSPKLLSFLRKHFSLMDFEPQANNFVVFRSYFRASSSNSKENLHAANVTDRQYRQRSDGNFISSNNFFLGGRGSSHASQHANWSRRGHHGMPPPSAPAVMGKQVLGDGESQEKRRLDDLDSLSLFARGSQFSADAMPRRREDVNNIQPPVGRNCNEDVSLQEKATNHFMSLQVESLSFLPSPLPLSPSPSSPSPCLLLFPSPFPFRPPPSPPPPYLALSLRWVGGRPADVLPASTLIYRMKERRTAGCGRMRRAAAMEGTP